MLDIFKQEAAKQLSELSGVEANQIASWLEAPKDLKMGDLAAPIPRFRLKGNPVQFAQDFAGKIQPNDYILSASAAGPYINFKINREILKDLVIKAVSEQKEAYGTNNSGNGETVIVEFSSPNIAKPFHAGHLRSTIIGNYVRNLLKANGYNTTAINYLGDWGKQYGLLAIAFDKYGSEELLEKDPINHLFEIYVKINAEAKEDETIHDKAREYFKRMEDGDEEALGVWSRLRAMSIEKYKEVYKRLNIQFDVYGGESQVNEEMIRAFNLLEEKGLLEESEGCKIVNLEKYKLGKVVVQKKDGTTLYITRDLGTAIQRFEKFNFSKMYYIIGSQQDLHCKQFFKILELLGFEWVKNCHHINFGMVAGMSTRAGTVVFLDSILNETRDKMHEVMKRNEEKYAQVENPESVADTIGMSAVVVQDMSARRILNYDFDWERMFSFEGDTGAYLQYAHARLCSIERKVNFEVNPNANTALLTEKEAIELIDVISKYPETIQTATQKFEPCTIVNYALKLSHSVSSCFEALNVMNAEKDVAEARLLLFWCAKVTLNNALRIIGLVPLERM